MKAFLSIVALLLVAVSIAFAINNRELVAVGFCIAAGTGLMASALCKASPTPVGRLEAELLFELGAAGSDGIQFSDLYERLRKSSPLDAPQDQMLNEFVERAEMAGLATRKDGRLYRRQR